jgi:membrane dipeptidase
MHDRPDRRLGRSAFAEMRRGSVGDLRRHPDRALREAGQRAAGMALAGAGVVDDAGRSVSGTARWSGAARSPRSRRVTSSTGTWHAGQTPATLNGKHCRSATSSASKARTRSWTLAHLERAYRDGLRAVGPAHYGPGTYAQGTDASGGIGAKGRELLAEDGSAGPDSRCHAPL